MDWGLLTTGRPSAGDLDDDSDRHRPRRWLVAVGAGRFAAEFVDGNAFRRESRPPVDGRLETSSSGP